jgi:hypothetical protein
MAWAGLGAATTAGAQSLHYSQSQYQTTDGKLFDRDPWINGKPVSGADSGRSNAGGKMEKGYGPNHNIWRGSRYGSGRRGQGGLGRGGGNRGAVHHPVVAAHHGPAPVAPSLPAPAVHAGGGRR